MLAPLKACGKTADSIGGRSKSTMSRVVVIGGSGHVGTYLVPRLVSAGFEVVSVSRGQRAPYQPHGAWKFVRTVTLDREAECWGVVRNADAICSEVWRQGERDRR